MLITKVPKDVQGSEKAASWPGSLEPVLTASHRRPCPPSCSGSILVFPSSSPGLRGPGAGMKPSAFFPRSGRFHCSAHTSRSGAIPPNTFPTPHTSAKALCILLSSPPHPECPQQTSISQDPGPFRFQSGWAQTPSNFSPGWLETNMSATATGSFSRFQTLDHGVPVRQKC